MVEDFEVEFPPRAEMALLHGGIAVVQKVVEEALERLVEKYECVKFSIAAEERCDSVPIRKAAKRLPDFAPEPPRPPNLKAPVLSFSARLLTYVNEKCEGNGAIAYKRAGVKKQIYSRIISSDTAQASKLTVMQLCIGLKLSIVEAERLMKSAGYAFSGSIPLDRAFTYCLENGIYNIRDVELILVANDLPSLKLKF